ncbi:TPA: universal stress protein [Escherichia coli]|nr:universal stress protein [Escherichia coli]EHB7664221.1 universal stress protein [Escherichia coli]EHD2969564.1 universal stress protein [Escherichia coli]EHE9876717.1 universal stress protein [Escherichia coli]EII9938699.1 universal stress protein [Escherichia coli]
MYRNIVIPVNVFSRDDREQAFLHAQFFANVSSGHVHLLGFIPEYLRVLERGYVSDMCRFKEALRGRALGRLAHMAAQLVLPEGFIHTYVHFGTLPEGMKELAEQQLADVIVLGTTQELSFIDILRQFSVPLLVI